MEDGFISARNFISCDADAHKSFPHFLKLYSGVEWIGSDRRASVYGESIPLLFPERSAFHTSFSLSLDLATCTLMGRDRKRTKSFPFLSPLLLLPLSNSAEWNLSSFRELKPFQRVIIIIKWLDVRFISNPTYLSRYKGDKRWSRVLGCWKVSESAERESGRGKRERTADCVIRQTDIHTCFSLYCRYKDIESGTGLIWESPCFSLMIVYLFDYLHSRGKKRGTHTYNIPIHFFQG